MTTSALCLNLFVSGLAFYSYLKARHFSWRLIWPFALTSVPAAFLGGLMKVPASFYSLLLACALLFAALRLLLNTGKNGGDREERPPLFIAFILGGGIGLLSGIVGVGGGIFLSPLLIFLHWADPRKTAAASAFFILVNSFSGLLGRFLRGAFEITPYLSLMVLAAFVGGILGSRLGAHRFSFLWLRRILALVLLLATFKLFRSLLV